MRDRESAKEVIYNGSYETVPLSYLGVGEPSTINTYVNFCEEGVGHVEFRGRISGPDAPRVAIGFTDRRSYAHVVGVVKKKRGKDVCIQPKDVKDLEGLLRSQGFEGSVLKREKNR